jgi:8-oxo-dGTP diphosphatase
MKPVYVAVAVIVDEQKQNVLLSLRSSEQHQGGFWEFPGGKVEPNETVYAALLREIKEELNLTVEFAEPLMQVSHDYADKTVFLDVWWVTRFQGQPQGREGQKIRWCSITDLQKDDFPAANEPIISEIHKTLGLAKYNLKSDI